jgi:hypothetical protein
MLPAALTLRNRWRKNFSGTLKTARCRTRTHCQCPQQVITAPWLRLKDGKRAGDLPLHLTAPHGQDRQVVQRSQGTDDFFSDVRLADFAV